MSGTISVSESYLESLGPVYKCPKGCGGTLIPVFVSYEQQGPLKKEWECSKCGKVVKGTPRQQNDNRKWTLRREGKRFKR